MKLNKTQQDYDYLIESVIDVLIDFKLENCQCCPLAKAQLRYAIEPFLSDDEILPQIQDFNDSVKIIEDFGLLKSQDMR